MANKTYTDKQFFMDVLDLIEEADLDDVTRGAMVAKANGKLDQLAHRAEYAATHRKPSQAKGASDATKALAAEIGAVLTDTPMTTAEINEILGADYSPLRVSNAVKYIPGVVSQKVVRETVDKNGLKVERQYTGYFIDS